MTELALELRGISKHFGTLAALEDVSFSAKRGSIHALLGENGAGKTTLMRIAFGMIRSDTGSISIDGHAAQISSPADAITAGIGMVHQQFSLVPAMSVAENVALGGRGHLSLESVADRIAEIGRRTGLVLDPLARVADLGSAERQKLEIVRTLAHNAGILILDEPTAVLTPKDIGDLFAQLRSFADSGGSVVLITHRLRDALRHADEVTVLRHGRVVLNALMSSVTEESLTVAMLGSARKTTQSERAVPAPHGQAIVTLFDAVFHDERRVTRAPITLEVFGGQILGIAALEGAAALLLRALAGRSIPVNGSIDIPDRVGFVPENRQDEAVIADFSLTENLALRNSGVARGLIEWDDMDRRTTNIIRDFDVIAGSSESSVRSLSGGNQQRFVLGRELEEDPPLLILENPTQGLDVKAAAAIHIRVREAAARGTAVVFYSSDLDELAQIADRVLIVRSTGMAFSEPDRDAIGRLLLEADTVREVYG